MSSKSAQAPSPAAAGRNAPAMPDKPLVRRGEPGRYWIGAVAVILGIVAWWLASLTTTPLFLPSPALVWEAAGELWSDGTLVASVWASSGRILSGWSLGLILGIPLGILMGHFRVVRLAFDPYIEFFRFIPPIAFVTLAVIWLGPGEMSKVALILYTTIFIVTINTLAGVLAVNPLRLRAAQALGASSMQTLRTVVVPSTVPYMVTGARLAMGNSFLTIVSAEIVAAQTGLGSLIWTARNYGRTDWVFVGIIALGILGFFFDRILRVIVKLTLRRYGATV